MGPSFVCPHNSSLEAAALGMADGYPLEPAPPRLGRPPYFSSNLRFSQADNVLKAMAREALKIKKAAQTHRPFLYSGASLAGYNLVPSKGKH